MSGADRPAPWLQIVGIGADGLAGLAPAPRAALQAAEVILGGARHHALTAEIVAERLTWPRPFDAMLDRLRALRGRRVAVLVTGEPSWCSAGTAIAAAVPEAERAIHPHPSAYQLAAARLGWALEGVTTLTVHGRRPEAILPALQPGSRLLVLAEGPETPERVAALLVARGLGPSALTVLAEMGGPGERRIATTAEAWAGPAPAFHTLAVEVRIGPDAQMQPAVPGLDDALFAHDGTLTKREVRAVTLARLAPMPGALLWDLGAGAGSVSVEWMRAARDARAIAVEPRADRRALAAANATGLGAPELEIREGRAPEALADLPTPDAVFFGGGIGAEALHTAWAALPRHGRMVANAVTLEAEATLLALRAELGGDLTRLQVSRAEPLGPGFAWRPAMAVTQYAAVKR